METERNTLVTADEEATLSPERKCPECRQWVEVEDGRYGDHGTTGNHDALGYEMPCPLSGGEVCDE